MSDQNLQNQLSKLATTFYTKGQPCAYGCAETNTEKMIERCRQIDNTKYYCTIAHWCIWIVQPLETEQNRQNKVKVKS
ncbi:hypothetical protein OAP14_02465, partial [Aliiglaciecola sp.]|nr:hypothetical protein [Aliiglaciecola sp.]